ncbi:class I SAM-dependent methyltransferase [Gammaproteobacteria bacterium]|nr:class I SAM-dependent methyltransferase [Gammaproteobacteria bacterium]
MVKYTGTNEEWNKNWQLRKEAFYTHWTKGDPENQIQLAFRNHWNLFSTFMDSPFFNQGKRVLEVGAGRGSLSSYFSEAGFDCTLLDLSPDVIEIAKKIFSNNNLLAEFLVGDAYNLDLEDNSFDLVFSIGVFEHFEDIATPIKEQIRILDKGGLFIAYIVPEYQDNVQKNFHWVNDILKGYVNSNNSNTKQSDKHEVYRSDRGSEKYIPVLEEFGLKNISSSGTYPVPMISHSINFPFSLMPPESEKSFVKYLESILKSNTDFPHPWMCNEGEGNAFVVWGYKD